jgi:hypothetical protein
MKIHRTSRRKRESGLITLVFVVLLTIMMILVTAESASLIHLHSDLKLLEKQQIKRLDNAGTNTATTVVSRLP